LESGFFFFLRRARLEIRLFLLGSLVFRCSKEKSETGFFESKTRPIVFPIFLKKFPAMSRTLRKAFFMGLSVALTTASQSIPIPIPTPAGTWTSLLYRFPVFREERSTSFSWSPVFLVI